MAFDDIPRTHSFSLGDFHDFDYCVFRFFVNHHLGKKYELAEGSENQTIGSLLDLAVKKFHHSNSYGQPVEYLPNLIKAAEADMREKVQKSPSPYSFFSPQIPFLTPEVIERANEIFKTYYQKIGGKFHKSLSNRTFWSHVLQEEKSSVGFSSKPLKLWGGPDTVEQGVDGIPEVIDYKYHEDSAVGKGRMDMDLMPKLYILLASPDLARLGFEKVIFKLKFWQDPKDESFYEEFEISNMPNLEAFFKDKMERILRTNELSFCEKPFCKACKSDQREEWIKQLRTQFNFS